MKYILVILWLVPYATLGQNIKTIAGTGIGGYNTDNITSITAQLYKPNSVSFDNAGNLYIADCANNRIRKINTYGVISSVAGTGIANFSGDNGPATLAELKSLSGIISDKAGNLYISSGDYRIRKVNSSTGVITTIAGTGTPGYNGENIQATAATLLFPYIGAVDDAGNIYFSDYGNRRVRKINTAGIITTFAGNGLIGSDGDGGPATAAKLSGPGFLFISATGDIYIPDNIAKKIRKIDAAGIITTFAGSGVSGNDGDGGPATAAKLISPNSITFDNFGNAYISDYGASVIRKVNSAGIISTIAGIGTSGYGGDGGPATNAKLTPNNVVCDGIGNVYIADVDNHRIRKVVFHPEAVPDINTILQDVSIYPNPVHDEVTVAWEGGTVQAGNEVTIVNIAGQEVISECPTGNTVTLHTAKLPAGVYLVTVNGAYAGRFVKE